MGKKRQSQAWKRAESAIAKALGGRRISRGDDFSRVDVDVVIDDMPELRVDSKYRQRHSHHTFVAEIVRKYCTEPNQVPVLVTKHARQESAFVTVPLEHYAFLLNVLRAYTKEQE